jgi:hypothetical protein
MFDFLFDTEVVEIVLPTTSVPLLARPIGIQTKSKNIKV